MEEKERGRLAGGGFVGGEGVCEETGGEFLRSTEPQEKEKERD